MEAIKLDIQELEYIIERAHAFLLDEESLTFVVLDSEDKSLDVGVEILNLDGADIFAFIDIMGHPVIGVRPLYSKEIYELKPLMAASNLSEIISPNFPTEEIYIIK